MKIAVLGSTGGTGLLVVEEAIRHGHEVTAFARRPVDLARVRGLADTIEGDARDRAAVERAVVGREAVIVAVSGGSEPGVCVGVAAAVTAAMQAQGVPRLVATSAYGIVATSPKLAAPIVRRIMRTHFTDQLAADELIAATSLDWTILRATRLSNTRPRRPPRLSAELFTKGPFSLSRAAYAEALLGLAEDGSHNRQIVNISG